VEYGDYLEFSRNADLLIHDAEYTEADYEIKKGWGHTRYMDALMLAFEADVDKFGLFHHNQERSDKELDGIIEDSLHIVENSGEELDCFAIYEGWELEL
jgi:ribonuclease BN (tRNA processing enzyme)